MSLFGTLQRSWRYNGLAVTVIVALNAAFVLALDHIATRDEHVTITLDGSSVTAQLNDSTLSKLEGAPQGGADISVETLQRRFRSSPTGIANVVVKALPSGNTIIDDSTWEDVASWQSSTEWYFNWRDQLLTSESGTVSIRDAISDNAVIKMDLINARQFNVLLRAEDLQNGLLLRWDGGMLAWYHLTNGQLSGAHGIARRDRMTLEERHDEFNAIWRLTYSLDIGTAGDLPGRTRATAYRDYHSCLPSGLLWRGYRRFSERQGAA